MEKSVTPALLLIPRAGPWWQVGIVLLLLCGVRGKTVYPWGKGKSCCLEPGWRLAGRGGPSATQYPLGPALSPGSYLGSS